MKAAEKVSEFGDFLVRIFPHSKIQFECGKIQARKTPHPDTFHAVWIFFSDSILRSNWRVFLKVDVLKTFRGYLAGLPCWSSGNKKTIETMFSFALYKLLINSHLYEHWTTLVDDCHRKFQKQPFTDVLQNRCS